MIHEGTGKCLFGGWLRAVWPGARGWLLRHLPWC